MKALLPWIRQGGIPSLSRDHNTLLTTAMPDSSQQICHEHNLIPQLAFIVPQPFRQKEAFALFLHYSQCQNFHSQDEWTVLTVRSWIFTWNQFLKKKKKSWNQVATKYKKHTNEMHVNLFYQLSERRKGCKGKTILIFSFLDQDQACGWHGIPTPAWWRLHPAIKSSPTSIL